MSIWPQDSTGRAVSKRPTRGAAAGALGPGLLALAALACASGGEKPPALAPQTTSSVASAERAAPAEPAPTGEPPARPASAIEKTIVIDEGGEADDRPTLLAAAEAERERRSRSDGPTVVINDENLKSKAIGQLTLASPAPRDKPEPEAAGLEPPSADSPAAETFWRERIFEARSAWREVVDEIDELESQVSLLRRRFYEEDDPYYRDSQIKPAWDRALDRLRVARTLADEAEALVVETLEEGRRAGALPGWMREGLDLEPAQKGLREARPRRLEEYEPGEPQVYDPDDDGGGGN